MTQESVHTVNRVAAYLEKLAEHYADEADKAESQEVTHFLDALRQDRLAHFNVLAQRIREHGELPKEPDQDAAFLEELFTHLYAMFKSDKEEAFLERALSGEEKLLGLVAEAREQSPPPALAEALEEVESSSRKAMTQLEAMRKRIRPGDEG